MREYTKKERSHKQEKAVAKTFRARPTAASGALWSMKGDVRSEKCLIECKTTEKSFYPVTTKVWEKIEEEAVKDHMRIPLLVVELYHSKRYVIFDPKYFSKEIDLLEVCRNKVTQSFRVYSWGKIVKENPMKFQIVKRPAGEHTLAVWTEEEFVEYFKDEI